MDEANEVRLALELDHFPMQMGERFTFANVGVQQSRLELGLRLRH
jgi:hypothetical protein